MTAHAVGALVFGSSDNWNFNASNPCLHFGGNYNQNQNHGPFYVNYNSVSNANTNIGGRLANDKRQKPAAHGLSASAFPLGPLS